MPIEAFFVHDITLRRAAVVPGRGADAVKDWANASEVTFKGWLAQQFRTDSRSNRDGDISGWLLQAPGGTDVRPGDRLQWGDLTFDVEGRPNNAWTPSGEHHVEANLRLVEG